MKIGTPVTVQRDEKKYPSRGTWRWFRGKKGVVIGTSLGEIGVRFDDGTTEDAWFHRYELKERKQ